MRRYFAMRRRIVPSKLLFLISLTLLFFVIPNFAQSEDESPIDSIHNEIIRLAEANHFSGSVLIAQHGEILLNEGYGSANLEWVIANAPDTKFRINSLTKQFTAMAIVRLQEQGSLNVNDLICDYLEECAEAWQDITIHHLLTNSSGIPDYQLHPDIFTMLRTYEARDDMLELFFDEPLDFPTGEGWAYSTSGYHLLGLIIEEVSGQSYERFLRDTFFEPLGMENTGLDNGLKVIGKRAEGYDRLISPTQAQYINVELLFSSGALYSTTEDLYLWEQALFSNAVVSQESWDEMMANTAPMPDGLNHYAYGLAILNIAGREVIMHDGRSPGFLSLMMYFPDDELNIIILSNFEGSRLNVLLPMIVETLLD